MDEWIARWVAVSERMPEKEQNVLIRALSRTGRVEIIQAHRFNEKWLSSWDDDDIYFTPVTHWLELNPNAIPKGE